MAVFLQNLKMNGHLENLPITIVNVGSRKVGDSDDYGSQGWDIFAPYLTIYGFDADVDACDAANLDLDNQNINWVEQHIPLVLAGSIGEATLYVTKAPICSSLYPPNEVYLQRFALPAPYEKYLPPCPSLLEVTALDFTVEVETTTLDSFFKEEQIDQIDYLQIDVQGADLQVLEGASEILTQSVLAVKIEVEFSPLYLNQPLFADVDIFLRNKGFTLFDLRPGYRRRVQSPICSNLYPGQLLWADAFYFRDPLIADCGSSFKTPESILKLACIADILHFPDYALELLEYLTLSYGNDLKHNYADIIIRSLAEIPDVLKAGLGSLDITSSIRNFIGSEVIKEYNL